jgi:hypothetical protein
VAVISVLEEVVLLPMPLQAAAEAPQRHGGMTQKRL